MDIRELTNDELRSTATRALMSDEIGRELLRAQLVSEERGEAVPIFAVEDA